MREFSAAIDAHLSSRGPRRAHLMVWIDAINRQTGAAETIGFWSGADHEDITVDGESRFYYGAGGLLKMSPLVIETGLKVRTQRITFSRIAPEVQLALRGFETRDRPCQAHVIYFDALTHQQIDTPVRVLLGFSVGLSMPRPKKKGGNATATLSVQTSAKTLTKTLPLKKSDAALRARASADGFRRYADVSGTVETVWGDVRATAPDAAPVSQSSKPAVLLRDGGRG